MADRVVQLLDDAGDKIYPISTLPDGQAIINVTNVDPGEGSALQEDHYTAVYGGSITVPDFTLTNVDPGEGSPLSADEYIGVYGSPNQIDPTEIDWSSFHGSTDMPIYVASNVNLGPFSMSIYRIGNLCYISGSIVTSSWASGNRQSTGKSLPVGFTPIREAIVTCLNIDGQYSNAVSSLTFNTDRTIMRSSNHSITSATRIDVLGVWITLDQWPSS